LPAQPDVARLVRLALVFYGLLAVAALGWIAWQGRPFGFVSDEAASQGVQWPRDVGLGLCFGVVLVVLTRVFSARTAAGRALTDALAELLGRPGLGACLVLAAVSGFAEEAFFRGALQPQVGLVAASLLFGLAHFVPRRAFLPWSVFGVLAGYCFGALFERTGNLVAPVLAHALVNALNLRWLAKRA
jgi:membrane protease YdiL (CAAX protease family)